MALIGNTNAEKIWNYLKSKGFNDYACAGIIGNLYAESLLNPMNLQQAYERSLGYTDETYTKCVDDGTYSNFVRDCAGYGLCQWTYWSRKKALLTYAKSVKKSIGDLEMQLDFFMTELSESYKPVLSTLKNSTSVLQASNAFLLKYERPADQSISVQNKRASYGLKYYEQYASNSVNSTPTPVTPESAMTTITVADSIIDKVITIANNEVGYLEKASNSQLDSKTGNAGSANYTKYGRDMHKLCPSVMDFPAAWCDCFVDWCFYKAYGADTAKVLLCGGFNDYTPSSAALFKNKNQWHSNPKVGDIIFFNNGTRICHVGLVYKVAASKVYTIEGNTSGASSLVSNGGGVCKKSYALSYERIDGYGRPDYSKVKYSVSEPINENRKLSKYVLWMGCVSAHSLNVRTWAGTENRKCSFSPLKRNAVVGVCDTVNDSEGKPWYYIKYNGKYGFVSSEYIAKYIG